MKLPFGKSKPKSATELAQEQRSSNSNSMRKDLSVDNKKKKIIIINQIQTIQKLEEFGFLIKYLLKF